MSAILFVSERYPPDIGGVATSAGRISSTLARLGHSVHVLTLTREVPAGNVDRRELGERLWLYRVGQSKNLDFSLQQAQTFLQWLHSQEKFSLVWGHYVQTAGFLAVWFARCSRIPSLLCLRGNDFDRQVFPPGDFARLAWCLQKANHLVAVTADLAARVDALVERIPTVLPNAVDTTVFQPGSREENLLAQYNPAKELLLGFSGELRAKKGLPFLLGALADLRRVRPTRLLVIGEVRPADRGEFERALLSLGVHDAVMVTGHLTNPADVARHLRLCDIFLLPSLWEGMPNGLLEAMAVGVPVVASDAGGIPEVIRDGENGILVPRTHLQQLGRRIKHWLELPNDRQLTLREAAFATIRERHSPAAEERNLKSLLAERSSS